MISMKGIELPISTIVVMILVLIVLIAIVGLFYGVWPSGSQAATLESAKSNACQMLTSMNGCKSTDDGVTKAIVINNFDANQDGVNNPGITAGSALPCKDNIAHSSQDNLFMLCKCWYNIGGADKDINDNCKKQVCGCST